MSEHPPEEHLDQNMIDEIQQQIIIDDEKSEFSEDFQSDQQNPAQINQQDLQKIRTLPKVANPVSSYSIFMRDWKQKHPQQKFNMSAIGQIWKELDSNQKEIYEKKYAEQKEKYDKYVAEMLAIDPNFGKKNNLSKNYLFPLHRIKTIMKQDENFTTTAQNVTAMAKAVEYFGEHLLDEIKKSAEGKKRIDLNDFFQTINTNQSNLWFLNCLIDQHNLGTQSASKANYTQSKKTKQSQKVRNEDGEEYIQRNTQKPAQRHKQKNLQKQSGRKSKQIVPQGQLKLTDMF